MLSASRRTGPAGTVVWSDAAAGFALAHRGAADAIHPRQPIVSSCGRFVLACDGQIYNAAELIGALPDERRAAAQSMELAALVEGAACWGVETALQQIEGEIAGVLWDRERRRLHLFRDRYGTKPLYWTDQRGWILFASELSALRAGPQFRAELDRDAAAAYLWSRAVPAPHTIYRGVGTLLPGTILTLTHDGAPEVHPYWLLREVAAHGLAHPFEGDDEAAIDRFDALLRDAVSLRVGRNPVGVLLSSGFDSALLAAVARDIGERPVSTFTVGFRQKALDEAGFARAIARHIGSDHHEIYLEFAQARDIIPELPEIFDEPNADISQIPALILSRMARGHVGVTLTGDGAAEAFGGGSGNFKMSRLQRRLEALPMPLRQLAKAGIRALPPDSWTALSRVLPAGVRPSHVGDRLHKFATILTLNFDELYRVFRAHWQDSHAIVIGSRLLAGVVGDPAVRAAVPDFFDRAHFFHASAITGDVIYAKADRAAAAAGVEVRFPYSDQRLVEFGWSLPRHFKQRGKTLKWVLCEASYRYIPQNLMDGRSMAFDMPMGEWLRGPLRDWAEDLLGEGRLKREGVFDPKPIRARWEEHLSGRRNWQAPLWVILMFQAWKQRWLPAG